MIRFKFKNQFKSFIKGRKIHLLFALFQIPFLSDKDWVQLQYRKIPANTVKIENQKSVIDVRSSSSPLVYKLQSPMKVEKLSFEMRLKKTALKGCLQKDDDLTKWCEDSVLRIGLVSEGEKTMNRFQKLIAPEWVKKLFELAPVDKGLDKIYFYMISQSTAKVGQERIHPLSEFMKETVIASTETATVDAKNADTVSLKMEYSLPKSLTVYGVWISVDGDATQSEFTTTLDSLTIF